MMIEAIMGVGVLVIVNIVMCAYSYGKLTQKVRDLGYRLTRVENKVNNKPVDSGR